MKGWCNNVTYACYVTYFLLDAWQCYVGNTDGLKDKVKQRHLLDWWKEDVSNKVTHVERSILRTFIYLMLSRYFLGETGNNTCMYCPLKYWWPERQSVLCVRRWPDHPAVSRVPLRWQVSVGGAEQRGSGRGRAPGAPRRRQPRQALFLCTPFFCPKS